MQRRSRNRILPGAIIALVALILMGVYTASASQNAGELKTADVAPIASSDAAIERLRSETGGTAKISIHRATGLVSFARFEAGSVALDAASSAPAEARAEAFFDAYGAAFGVNNARTELELVSTRSDYVGMSHLTYQQKFGTVPVWAAVLQVHFDAQGELVAVNGTFIPNIAVNARPTLNADAAAGLAVADVVAKPSSHDDESDVSEATTISASDLSIQSNTLYVYRAGLAQGVAGSNHLAYEVQVVSGATVREFVYVDAHSGAILDRWSGVHNALNRRVYEMSYLPGSLVWQEGDPFPGALNADQQRIVEGSGESYYFFWHAFARDSYDAGGAAMETVNNDPGIACPNANWNGTTTNYCNGVTSDDVVAHEWGHAYTEYTNGLIYAWQSGAMNESYSDIWGETVDQLNGRETDAPGTVRTVGVCSNFTSPNPVLTVNAPGTIAGDYAAGAASFGPPLDTTGITGNLVLALDDGGASPSDVCENITNAAALAGNVAVVDRGGGCGFAVKVKKAQDAGAIAVVVADNQLGPVSGMSGSDATITIPSVRVTLATGNLIKAELANGVNATMHVDPSVGEDSYRWLMGEDSTAFGEAIRDMWDPTCKLDPGKVTDVDVYVCTPGDNGGVHSNSGVPNHSYALLVDGGTYNGQTITSIGLTKAAHIYWGAQLMLTPASNFADLADALEASCSALATAGTNLPGLGTGSTMPAPSGEVVTAADCTQVANAIAAVEFRTDPATQCNFQPLLAPNAPALCASSGGTATTVQLSNFDTDLGGWTVSNSGVYTGWTPRDWVFDNTLPGGRIGGAAYAVNMDGACDEGAGDQSGALFMESGDIVIPTGVITPHIAFDHYVATEAGYDGGNLKISINGGAFQVVSDTAYIFNAHNTALVAMAPGGNNTNPLGGEDAFSGTDGGELTGSWGQSQIDLSALGVMPGDTIRLRYDFGQDGCAMVDGWYVDDVHVYTCPNMQTAVDLSDISVAAPTRSIPVELLAAGLLGLSVGALFVLRRKRA